MIGELLELLGAVASGSIPTSRRQLLVTIAVLSLLGEVVLVGALLITWAGGEQTLFELILGEQWWKVGLLGNTVVLVVLIATITILVVRERDWEKSAQARIGKRPRHQEHDS